MIRHILSEFRAGRINAQAAGEELELSRSRFYELYSDYLAAGPQREEQWVPGGSGGDHAPDWPPEVKALLRARLNSRPPSSDSFAASEVFRKHEFKVDRAQVRRWAIQNDLAHPLRVAAPPAPVRRWQRSRIGELWQLDATPHPFFPGSSRVFHMLNLIDDCSRLLPGSKLYHREVLLAYYDLLPEAFCLRLAAGPVCGFPQLLLYRPSAGSHRPGSGAPFLRSNLSLCAHARSPKPNCPWWPFVWSLRTSVRVDSQGRVPIGAQSIRIEAPPGTRVVLCLHPSGHHSILTHPPKQNTLPVILFSDLPN